MLFPCPFRFEKPLKKSVYNSDYSSSSGTVDLAELTEFNKIMENQFKEKMNSKFHKQFHNINDMQNKEIDKKIIEQSRIRNAGQVKYLIKKRVNKFKNKLDSIQIHLGKLDGEIKE